MASAESRTLNFNFNVGVLGHVDSGKTSLSKAISTTASTASFDKNPQSKERGITLDLGFSSFVVAAPEQISKDGYENLQYTLVDCPGHASLIRTIIGKRRSYLNDLLLKSDKGTVLVVRQRTLCIEIFKTVKHLNPPFMQNIFKLRSSNYSLRNPNNLAHVRPNQTTLPTRQNKVSRKFGKF